MNALGSLYGPNRTPISSAIYPRIVIDKLLDHDWREIAPSVLEDHFLLHWAMSFSENDEVFIPEILSFISIHGADQTVTNQDTQIWIDSMSTIRRLTTFSGVLSPRRDLVNIGNLSRTRSREKSDLRKLFRLLHPSTFRVIWGFKVFSRLLKRDFSFRELIDKFLNH